MENTELTENQKIATATITGMEIWKTTDEAYFTYCPRCKYSSDHYVTDFDAKADAKRHWLTTDHQSE